MKLYSSIAVAALAIGLVSSSFALQETTVRSTTVTPAKGVVVNKNIKTYGNPGVNNSSPTNLLVHEGLLYFTADNGVDGVELWKSDGTDAGTIMVKDINVSGSSDPTAFTVVNGLLYFAADDGVNGTELWTRAGTSAGGPR